MSQIPILVVMVSIIVVIITVWIRTRKSHNLYDVACNTELNQTLYLFTN